VTDPKDLALVLQLIEDTGQVVGRTRFQKLVFLAKREKKVPFSFEFPLYYYGPYSEGLQDLIDVLVANELVAEETFTTHGGSEGYKYSLTPQGTLTLEQVVTQLGSTEKRRLKETVEKYGTQPLREILDHVYSKYVNADDPELIP
jgi:uncharacterized protein YwgA